MFSEKEMGEIEKNWIFLYDDSLNGIPVFFPLRKDLSFDGRRRMQELTEKYAPFMFNIIRNQRLQQDANSSTNFSMDANKNITFDYTTN